MKNRVGVIYTCITGNYDALLDHKYVNPSWDYVCFTDVPNMSNSNNKQWEVRPLQYTRLDATRNQRWHKINAHKLFQNYKRSIWVDGNIDVRSNKFFSDIDKLIANHILIAAGKHLYRDDIYKELEACLELKKDDPQTMREQVAIYKKEKFPSRSGLFETGILYRMHNEKIVVEAMRDWWYWVKKYSKRDQLSLSYVLWKNQLKIELISRKSYRLSTEKALIRPHQVQMAIEYPKMLETIDALNKYIKELEKLIEEVNTYNSILRKRINDYNNSFFGKVRVLLRKMLIRNTENK